MKLSIEYLVLRVNLDIIILISFFDIAFIVLFYHVEFYLVINLLASFGYNLFLLVRNYHHLRII